MQVILIQDMDNLGAAQEVVNVRPGYARNYLIPQRFAVEASPANLKMAQEKARVKAKKEAALLQEINRVADTLKASPVKIGAKTGTSGKIFGAVTNVQVARAIREQKGYDVDRRKIHILDEIKELGNFKARVDFGNGHETEIELEIVAE